MQRRDIALLALTALCVAGIAVAERFKSHRPCRFHVLSLGF